MDYKYIEQLLDRYWECETSREEEAILRNFFAQDNVPEHLMPYRDVFAAEQELAGETLSEDFDARVISMIQSQVSEPAIKARTISLHQRLRPLYKATGLIAILLTLGMAAEQGMRHPEAQEADVIASHIGQDTSVILTDMPEVVDQASASIPQTGKDSLCSQLPLTDGTSEVAN